jgi:hypothetical protein
VLDTNTNLQSPINVYPIRFGTKTQSFTILNLDPASLDLILQQIYYVMNVFPTWARIAWRRDELEKKQSPCLTASALDTIARSAVLVAVLDSESGVLLARLPRWKGTFVATLRST